ncbi:MAG: LysM domain-containing protein, partial [Psychrobacter pacificensis]
SYTVGSGDSLIGLARKYGVSTQELAEMNNIAADTMLQRGQRLTVPNRLGILRYLISNGVY